MIPIVEGAVPWTWAFAVLAVGPIVGVVAMRRLESPPEAAPPGPVEVEMSNETTKGVAVIMGTYNEGFGRDDLVASGRDVSTGRHSPTLSKFTRSAPTPRERFRSTMAPAAIRSAALNDFV